MGTQIQIYLVRHGQSAANLDKSVNRSLADHVVPLSDEGRLQAFRAGSFLGASLAPAIADGEKVAVYVSPYLRTRETWQGILRGMGRTGQGLMKTESIFLREIEFGLFDGVPDEELPVQFPDEHAHYEKMKRCGGEFYARMPGGESRCDVAQRVHQFFGTLHRDRERHGIDRAIVVSHGVTIRAFVMMWLGLPPEWMEEERNPLNCSIRLLQGGQDVGYILNGREGHRTAQELREEGTIDGSSGFPSARPPGAG